MAVTISTEWPVELLCDDDDLAGESLELRAMEQAEAYAAYVEAEVEAMAEEEAEEAGHPVGWYEPTCTCSTCRAIRGSGSCRQQLYRIDPKDETGAWAF